MHIGKCFCGNVSLKIPHLPEKVTRCNCSICSRYAAIWGYFKQKEVTIDVQEHGVSKYAHGDKCISFVRCDKCHCITHYISNKTDPEERLAVNFRMFDATLLSKMKMRYFDGADTWKAMKKSQWIQDGKR